MAETASAKVMHTSSCMIGFATIRIRSVLQMQHDDLFGIVSDAGIQQIGSSVIGGSASPKAQPSTAKKDSMIAGNFKNCNNLIPWQGRL